MDQLGILSSAKRERKMSDLGDNLEQLIQIINWEMFRATLERAVRKEAKGSGGGTLSIRCRDDVSKFWHWSDCLT